MMIIVIIGFDNHRHSETTGRQRLFSFSRKRDFTTFLLTLRELSGPLDRPLLSWGTQTRYSSSPKPHIIITTMVPTS